MFTVYLERISFFSPSCGSSEAQNQMLVKAKPVLQPLLGIALWRVRGTQVVGPLGRGPGWAGISSLPTQPLAGAEQQREC